MSYKLADGDITIDMNLCTEARNVLYNKKYPSIKNIKQYYYRIGIPNIFHQLNNKGGRNYETALQSFLDVRESLAHQSPSAVTYNDLRRYLNDIIEIVKYLDKILYSHIVKNCGGHYWPN